MGGEKGGSWDKPTTPFPVEKGQGGLLKERVKNSGGKERGKRRGEYAGRKGSGISREWNEGGREQGGEKRVKEKRGRGWKGAWGHAKRGGGDEKREESLHHLAFHLTALLRRRLLLLSAPLFSVLRRAIRSEGKKFRIESGFKQPHRRSRKDHLATSFLALPPSQRIRPRGS